MGVGKEGVWGWEGRYLGRVRTLLAVVNRWVLGGEAQAMGGGWRRLVGVKGSQGGCSEVENVPPSKKTQNNKTSQRAFTLELCWWEVKGVLRSDFPAGSSPTLLPCIPYGPRPSAALSGSVRDFPECGMRLSGPQGPEWTGRRPR